ncbi:MAG TPA: S9 family peptidase, partial [Thermoanaerobaculia bacterium]|nr:S9 family peptidase [Thermoanaerobaculia bacterium]
GRLAPVLAVLLLAAAFLPALPAAAAKRPLTETDLFRFVWIADPQISPDGHRIAFVRVTVNAKKDGYDTALWVAATDGSEPPRPLTAGPGDSSPRWSPSGRQLAFVRAPAPPAEKTGDEAPPQIYVLNVAGGGEARAVTDLPRGAGSPAWSPDGRTLAFSSSTNAKDLEKKKAGKKKDEEYESDVRVITRATYRRNGGGYNDILHPGHIWTVTLPEPPADPAGPLPEPRQVTQGDLDESPPTWSPDGSLLYFLANRTPEPYYQLPDDDLYAVPAHGGAAVKVVDIDGPVNDFTPSPDGKRIAFLGYLNPKPERSYNQPDLFVVDRAPGTSPRNLTANYDYDIGDDVGGDQHSPRGDQPTSPVWSRDQRTLYAVAAERGRANLQKVDVATGKVTPLTTGDRDVVSYTATPDGARFALVISTPTAIGDLWALDAASGRLAQLTRFNDPLFAEIDLTPPEEIVYKSFDGKEIQAWVQRPPGFDPAQKYPLILDIHGGPHSAYGWTFDHEFQWMAAKGYLVLYPNPRGSASYGQEFGNVIQYHYPGDDYKDLMAGVDELVRRGWADPDRLGVTGGSGGGILTNWIVTQTDRFKAAVAQRSIADWSSFWYTADFTLFTPSWFKGAPWEDPEDFRARSPITHVANVKTPLMLIEGEADYRTPPGAGGEQMFRALKYLKKPVVMVRFPDESHELSRSGKPWHRIERLRHIVGWFDKYLEGQKVDTYGAP